MHDAAPRARGRARARSASAIAAASSNGEPPARQPRLQRLAVVQRHGEEQAVRRRSRRSRGSCRRSDDRAPRPRAPRPGSAAWRPRSCAQVRREELQRDVPLRAARHGPCRRGPSRRRRAGSARRIARRGSLPTRAPARAPARSAGATASASRSTRPEPSLRSEKRLDLPLQRHVGAAARSSISRCAIALRRTRSRRRAGPGPRCQRRATSCPAGCVGAVIPAAPDSARRAPSPIPA